MYRAIARITDEIVRIMDGKIHGIWLYGSVAMNDFRMGWSDIDFVALTAGKISQGQAEEMLFLRQNMQEKEPDNPYYRLFEGVIADFTEYRDRSFSRSVYWGTSGQRVTDSYALDAFALFELKKYGRPVSGVYTWALPAPGKESLVEAVRRHYDTIRSHAVTTDGSLYSCGWLLDIARCIYTLRSNDIIAKTQAGMWALNEHIFADEEPLMKTLEIRRDPLKFKGDSDLTVWLKSLGPAVQRCADVLERELLNE